MSRTRNRLRVDQLPLFPSEVSFDQDREKLALVDQTLQMLGRAHAEALWIDLGLPSPKGARQSSRVLQPVDPTNPLHAHVRRFVDDCLDPDPLSEVRTEAVYRTYVDWAHRKGEHALSCHGLGKILKRLGMPSRRSNNTIYCGVRIRSEAAKIPDPSPDLGS